MGVIYNPTFKPGDNLPADVVNNIIKSVKEDESTLATVSAKVEKQVSIDDIYSKDEIDEKINKKADKANEYGGFAGGEASNPQYGAAIGKGASTQNGGAVGQNASAQTGGAVGQNAKVSLSGGAVGSDAESGMGFAGGTSAKSTAQDAIQLGTGTNNAEKTLQVYSYQLMDADGHIPNDRMPTKADVDNVYTKTEIDTKLGNNPGTLTFDSTPTSGSTNPVTSDGIKTELDKKADKENGTNGFVGGSSSSATNGAAIGAGASATSGGAVGRGANATTGGAIGDRAYSNKGFAGGDNAKSTAQDAIQLGTGTNDTEKTLQVYDYQLMDADGRIPSDRMPTSIYTKKQIDDKMNLVCRIKGSLDCSGTPASVENCEIGDIYNILSDDETGLVDNSFDFSTSPKEVIVQDNNLVGFHLLHLRSDISETENPPTITLRYNGVSKTFNISKLQQQGENNVIVTSTDIYSAFGIDSSTPYITMILFSIANNWIEVPNGANIVWTEYGWDILSATVDTSNYYTKDVVDTKLDNKVDKIEGKGLSTEDYTYAEKQLVKHAQMKPEVTIQENETQILNVFSDGNIINIYKNTTTDIESFVINIPEQLTVDGSFLYDVSFKTGATAPSVVQTLHSHTLVWLGTDCELNNNEYVFNPQVNKYYDIMFYYNGNNFVGLVTGYSL